MHLKLFVIIIFCPIMLFAQSKNSYELKVNVSKNDSLVFSDFKLEKHFRDSIEAKYALEGFISKLQSSGFLLSGIDSLIYQQNFLLAFIHIGSPYKWMRLDKGNLSNEIVKALNIKEKYLSNTFFEYNEFNTLRNQIIEYGQNNGYPFSKLELDSVLINQQKVFAKINFKIGSLVKFDTIIFKNNNLIKSKFLASYLRIIKGQPYNKKLIVDIEKKIKLLPYLKLKTKPWVKFSQNLAYLNLFLEPVKSNKINLFIGLLPDNNNDLQFVGEFLVELNNPFKAGKRIYAEGKRFKKQSQSIVFEYDHPFIFNSKFNLSLNFSLLKEDTTFLNLERGFSIDYNNFNAGKLAFISNYKSTRALNNNFNFDSNLFPEFASTSYFSYGMKYTYKSSGNIQPIKKGGKIEISIQIGQKKIDKDNSIQDSIYNDLELKSNQLKFQFDLYKYISLGKKNALLVKTSFGSIVNKNLFVNELYRIGGKNLLRGFDENVFFVSDYIVNTIEPRFYFGTESYLFLFSDFAFINSSAINNKFTDYPFGFGGGINLRTKSGFFSITYALGAADIQPLNTRLSKIYFGLINKF